MRLFDDNPESAKQFLLEKLLEQAQRDNVTLSDIERRMFLFSETSGETDWEANERFDHEYDTPQYETKIAQLLRHSYAHDKKSVEDLRDWTSALQSLRNVDFYGLVMVDKARIPRPKPRISVIGKQIAGGFFRLNDPSYFAVKVAIAILALGLAFDPLHLGVIRGDGLKLLCIAIGAAGIWLLGHVEKRRLLRKVDENAEKPFG